MRGVTVVDDYGHHPTEIRATLSAARESGYRHVHVIFQPHRYTRTRDLMADFATAFDEADTVQILDIYAASEEPIPGVDAPALVRAIGRKEVQYAASFEEAISRTVAQAVDGDVIVTLGAGSVSQAAPWCSKPSVSKTFHRISQPRRRYQSRAKRAISAYPTIPVGVEDRDCSSNVRYGRLP